MMAAEGYLRWLALLFCLLLVLAGVWLRLQPEKKNAGNETRVYESLSQLEEAQRAVGFVRIGRFGDDWPAHLVELQEGKDSIRFVRADGTPHQYRGFDGYRLKVMRLQGRGGDEVLVVLRSTEKAGSATKAAPPTPAEDEWERQRREVMQERAHEE